LRVEQRLVDHHGVGGGLHLLEDDVDRGLQLDQRRLVLELGDGDLLAVDPAGVEALHDLQLDGPEIAEALDGRISALVEQVVIALLDAAAQVDMRIEGRFRLDDEALRPLDVVLRLENGRVPVERELQAVVERIGRRWLARLGQQGRGDERSGRCGKQNEDGRKIEHASIAIGSWEEDGLARAFYHKRWRGWYEVMIQSPEFLIPRDFTVVPLGFQASFGSL